MPAQNNWGADMNFDTSKQEFIQLMSKRMIEEINFQYDMDTLELFFETPEKEWVIHRMKEISFMACIHFKEGALKPLWKIAQEQIKERFLFTPMPKVQKTFRKVEYKK